jgi:hypothetical protein
MTGNRVKKKDLNKSLPGTEPSIRFQFLTAVSARQPNDLRDLLY